MKIEDFVVGTLFEVKEVVYTVWRFFEGFVYLWKRDGPKVSTFGPTLTLFSSWRWPKSKKISSSAEKFQSLSYPNMSKKSLYLISIFRESYWLLSAIFGIFLPGNRVGSQVKGIESKYYFIHRIPGQLPVKKFGSNIFQFCGYRSQRTFQKIFNPDFQIWLVFLVPFLHCLKTWCRI